ncbi:DUF4240 domain-containing protein [Promicromonospora sp. NPDC057488]|uniref:DUF4240 domain-containing protein n=1 Tax=Promicromonospora sp. NPDC057488 TaxID=3346147 RepID=UPI00366E9395
MDAETFWLVVDEIRGRAEAVGTQREAALSDCVVDVLAGRLDAQGIVAFNGVASAFAHQADTLAMAAAMFLIEGYVSDDTFMDFRDGVILLGRRTFEAALTDPDSLVDHPIVAGATASARGAGLRREVSFESIVSSAVDAWVRVTGAEDEDDFWVAGSEPEHEARAAQVAPAQSDEPWDVSDADEIRRRLPRLAEVFAERLRPRMPAARLP